MIPHRTNTAVFYNIFRLGTFFIELNIILYSDKIRRKKMNFINN